MWADLEAFVPRGRVEHILDRVGSVPPCSLCICCSPVQNEHCAGAVLPWPEHECKLWSAQWESFVSQLSRGIEWTAICCGQWQRGTKSLPVEPRGWEPSSKLPFVHGRLALKDTVEAFRPWPPESVCTGGSGKTVRVCGDSWLHVAVCWYHETPNSAFCQFDRERGWSSMDCTALLSKDDAWVEGGPGQAFCCAEASLHFLSIESWQRFCRCFQHVVFCFWWHSCSKSKIFAANVCAAWDDLVKFLKLQGSFCTLAWCQRWHFFCPMCKSWLFSGAVCPGLWFSCTSIMNSGRYSIGEMAHLVTAKAALHPKVRRCKLHPCSFANPTGENIPWVFASSPLGLAHSESQRCTSPNPFGSYAWHSLCYPKVHMPHKAWVRWSAVE